jgi:hypothetical protein
MADQLEFDDAWQQLVARAWSDPALKAKLLADPAGVLKANGLTVPKGVTVRVVENTDKALNLVLPVKPAPEELSEEELHKAAGGRQNMVYDSDQGPNHDIGRLTGDCDPNDDRYT